MLSWGRIVLSVGDLILAPRDRSVLPFRAKFLAPVCDVIPDSMPGAQDFCPGGSAVPAVAHRA